MLILFRLFTVYVYYETDTSTGVGFPRGVTIFSLVTASRTDVGPTQPPIQSVIPGNKAAGALS
jgi:hypothetical protein